jgi:hypothetical protein
MPLRPALAVAVIAAAFGLGGSGSRADAGSLHATLEIVKAGTGTGHVGSEPPYINCGQVCIASVPGADEGGSSITLRATPDPGGVFVRWIGGCDGTNPTCSFVVQESETITAIFDRVGAANTFPLAVGTMGSGTVTSSPGGISCGTVCSAQFVSGTSVTLTATPAAGWAFSSWGGACAGTGSCTITMDGPKSVTATFIQTAAQTYPLAVAKTGDGSVTSIPPGIECGSACSASFPAGVTVTLTAAPAAGQSFAGWTGACSGSAPSCTVTMNGPKTVSAAFGQQPAPPQTFPLAVSTTGSGTVTSTPSGIDCGATCSATFANGTAVTLTAAAAPGWTFAGWSGACSGTGGCVVPMDAPRSVTAAFQQAAPQTFPLAVGTTGTGTVTSNPAGISCGATCSASFTSGTVVTLIAAAAPGSAFVGWSGACSGTAPTCSVTVDGAKSVTALFRDLTDTDAQIGRAHV